MLKTCYRSGMRPSIAAALAFLSLACAGGEPATDPIVMRDSAGVAIVENDLLRLDASCSLGATPTVSIGEEDGGEEYLLAGVQGARRLSDGRIAIGNQTTWQVRWYSPEGQYIRSAGRQGAGPGEFSSPYTLHVMPGDTVYAGNSHPFYFLVFDPDGRYVRTVTPNPVMGNPARTMGFLSDGRMMLGVDDISRTSNVPGEFVAATRTIRLHAADGTLIDTVAQLPHGSEGKLLEKANFYTMPMFEAYSHSTAADSIIVLGHGAERELRILKVEMDGNTRLIRLIRWSGGSTDVTEQDVARERAREKAEYDRMDQRMRQMFKDGYETQVHPSRPIAKVMPSMNGIRIGTDGRIWVRQFQPPADTTARKWIAFTRDGRFDCALRAPNYGVEQIGPDFMLVVDRDSLGVERVKQFPLSRP